MALSVYAYFGDPSFALLLLRVIVQMRTFTLSAPVDLARADRRSMLLKHRPELSRPQAHAHRTLPFFARLVTTLFFGSVFRNQLYGPGSGAVNPPSGVFLDFIGRGKTRRPAIHREALGLTLSFPNDALRRLFPVCDSCSRSNGVNLPAPARLPPRCLRDRPLAAAPRSTAPLLSRCPAAGRCSARVQCQSERSGAREPGGSAGRRFGRSTPNQRRRQGGLGALYRLSQPFAHPEAASIS